MSFDLSGYVSGVATGVTIAAIIGVFELLRRRIRDLNNAFKLIRSLDDRLKALEGKKP